MPSLSAPGVRPPDDKRPSVRWDAQILCVVLIFGLFLGLAGARNRITASQTESLYTREERIGVSFVGRVPDGDGYVDQSISEYDLSRLKVGWYSDFDHTPDPDMPSSGPIEYAQLLRVRDSDWPPDWDDVQLAVTSRPGSLWIVGNEPECRNQDNLAPPVYAERYHLAYQRIKSYDPTALLAIGGIVEPTPLRLIWLDRALAAYESTYGVPMPQHIDVWNIHVQILEEWRPDDAWPQGYNYAAGAGIPQGVDPVAEGLVDHVFTLPIDEPETYASAAVFGEMVRAFREWMKAHGAQGKPLIISEMGVVMPSIYVAEGGDEEQRKERGDRLIQQFMSETFEWLLTAQDEAVGQPEDGYRLVQRWMWFSLNGSLWPQGTGAHQRGFNGSLYDFQTKELLPFGQTFVALQSQGQATLLPLVY